MEDVLSTLAPLAAGVALAAVAGLRAFLPLFALGLAGRFEWIQLGESFEWLAQPAALVAFGSASLLEIAGDKIPVVDHLLDALGTAIRPIAGAIAAAAVLSSLDPLWTAVLAIVLGGGTAGTIHLAKAKTRAGVSLTTAGVATPLVSLGEDVMALLAAGLAIAWPWLALLAVVMLVSAAWLTFALASWSWRSLRGPARA